MAWPQTAIAVVLSTCVMYLAAAEGIPPLPPNTVVLNFGRFSNRNFQLTCVDKIRKNPGCNATCPNRCPNRCIVLCPACRTFCLCDFYPGMACEDPRFVGGDGNHFYFHGRKNHDFCVVSDANLHINAHFIGKRNPAMSRDFTWIQAIGVRFDNHRLYVGAQKTATWDNSIDRLTITFDGAQVYLPTELNARWVSTAVPTLSVMRLAETNSVVVELKGVLAVMASAVPITKEDSRIHNYGVTSDDCLAHLDLGFKFHALTDDVHGVLGQTYRPDYVNKLDVRAKMPVMGGAAKFLSSDLFSTDCAVTRFGRRHVHRTTGGITMVTEHVDSK